MSQRIRRRGIEAEFYEYSTLHGISDIYRARHWCMRVMWLNLFVGALVGAVYGCQAIIEEFIAQPVVVSLFVREGDNMTLPDVVVCPFNRFNQSFFRINNVSDELAQYLEMSFPAVSVMDFQVLETNKIRSNMANLELQLKALMQKLGGVDFTKLIHMATEFDCHAIVKKITYATVDENNPRSIDCDSLDTMMTSAGKCFRVPGRVQRGAGFNQGVRVTLTLPHELFHPGVNQLLLDGVAVKLAEKGKGANADLFFVPSGVHAIMTLRATRYEFMNVRGGYFECDENPAPDYSRLNCFESCVIEDAEKNCNCSLVGSTNPKKAFCPPIIIYQCYVTYMMQLTKEKYEGCRHRCIQPCGFWQYQATVTYAKFPSPEARHFVTDNETWSELQNTIILEVFFENLEYTLINHVEKHTPYSFIAQIGGQVSLWSGASILTMLQLIIFFLQLLYDRCFERPPPESAQQSNSYEHGDSSRRNNGTNALLNNFHPKERQRETGEMTALSMQHEGSNYCILSSSDLTLSDASNRRRLEALV